MDRSQFKNHSMYPDKIYTGVYKVPQLVPETDANEDTNLLRMIYTYSDGEISGDLAIFLNDKVNPAIREYISQNLLQQHTAIGHSDLSDDDLLALSRQPYESTDTYGRRVLDYIKSLAPKDAEAVNKS